MPEPGKPPEQETVYSLVYWFYLLENDLIALIDEKIHPKLDGMIIRIENVSIKHRRRSGPIVFALDDLLMMEMM